MRYVHVEQLKSIRDDFEAARAVMEFVEAEWDSLQEQPFVRGLSLGQVRTTASRLEATYLIKLFAEFEGILRASLATIRPGRRLRRTPTEALINSVALRLRIPDYVRDGAHDVRKYRNVLVHPDGEAADAMSFGQAVSLLNHFLVWLPNPT